MATRLADPCDDNRASPHLGRPHKLASARKHPTRRDSSGSRKPASSTGLAQVSRLIYLLQCTGFAFGSVETEIKKKRRHATITQSSYVLFTDPNIAIDPR